MFVLYGIKCLLDKCTKEENILTITPDTIM